jgi:exosortase E/protease (VPEID-CTERM system)
VLALTYRFDLSTLRAQGEWWAWLLRHAPVLARLAVTTAAAAVLFCGPEVFNLLRTWQPLRLAGGRRLALLLLTHAAVITAVYRLTECLLEEGAGGAGVFLAWAAAGLAAAVALALAVLPAAAWAWLAARLWPSLLVAAAVGAIGWGGGLVMDRLWEPLGRSTLWAVRGLVGLAVDAPVYDPAESLIGTQSFVVEIAPQCSGFEGIGLVLAFAGGYLWLYRRELRFPQALVLLPLGAALAWSANAVRIAALVLVGTWIDRGVAAGGFHSQAGWLAFNAVALGLVLLAHRSRVFAQRPDPGVEGAHPGRPDLTAAYLLPFLVLVAVSMLTAAFSAGFDWLYPVRVAAVGAVLWHYRRYYPRFRWSWAAVGIGLAAAAAWMLLPPGEDGVPAELAGVPAGWAAAWVTCRLVGSCLTAPLAEELAFRGYMTRRLVAERFEDVPPGRFTWLSFVVTSALSGMLTGSPVAGTVAGALYALALYRRGELSDAVVAHAATNAALAGYALASGRWGVWA